MPPTVTHSPDPKLSRGRHSSDESARRLYRAEAATGVRGGRTYAFDLVAALFRAHPEFAEGEFEVEALGSGLLVVRPAGERGSDPSPGDDPVLTANGWRQFGWRGFRLRFRQLNILGPAHRHWYRARYRRYQPLLSVPL